MQIQRTLCFAAVCSVTLLADSLELKSGRTVEGTYLGGDSRTVRMLANDKVETFDVGDLRSIRFGSPSSSSAASASSSASHSASSGSTSGASGVLSPSAGGSSAAPRTSMSGRQQRAAVRGLDVPAGTNLVIRLIDDVDSQRDSVGKTYRASLDESLMVDGNVVVPRGADVTVKLVDDKQAGRLSGKTVLTLDVDSLVVDGRTIEIQTQEITQESKSQTAQTGKATAGVAALGAVIGGIAGGGKGAAIGAVSGAAVGAGSQVLLKGQRVRVPSETRLTFSLQQPVRL